MLKGCYGSPEATTEIMYSQSIDSCIISKFDLPLVKNVSVCDTKIGCPICNEDARFELVESGNSIRLSEINGIRVKKCEVFFLPKFHHLSKNLKFLSITNSELRKITQKNLQELINLESLDLGGNKIQSLEEGTFEHNAKIKAIHLSSNPISFVAPEAFERLKHFVLLSFKSINCYSITINKTDSNEMRQELTKLTSSCSRKNTITPANPENCNKSSELESLDYFDGSAVSTSSISSNVNHMCTHSVTHCYATDIKLYLFIQTCVIAALFIAVFVMIYQIQSSKVESLYRGSIHRSTKPKENLWMSKSKSLHSINNDSYDQLPVRMKPSDYEDVLSAAMNNGNANYEDVDNKVEVEELYSDIQDKKDNKNEDFNLYAIPKTQEVL